MPKRKKTVSEDTMQVTMMPKPGQTTTTGNMTVDVNANDPTQALQQAQAQLPGKKMGQVMIGPKKTKATPMGVTQQPAMGTSLTPESTEMTRLKYPYGIVVPAGFGEVIGKAVLTNKRVIPGVTLGESHGRITLQIKNTAAMATFVSRLGKSKDRRAKFILEGIKGSV